MLVYKRNISKVCSVTQKKNLHTFKAKNMTQINLRKKEIHRTHILDKKNIGISCKHYKAENMTQINLRRIPRAYTVCIIEKIMTGLC